MYSKIQFLESIYNAEDRLKMQRIGLGKRKTTYQTKSDKWLIFNVVHLEGFEPSTSSSVVRCSIQLSYKCILLLKGLQTYSNLIYDASPTRFFL